ncbi:MAG TPA: hypothetical protein GX721_08425 [Firmicutes bacterium]|nr:hypothetical protein [Bacillota bacterium]
MKRLISAMAIILVLVVAAPVLAAPSINVGGSLSTVFQIVPSDPIDAGISATSDLHLELSMEMAGGNQVRGYIGFALTEWDPFENEAEDPELGEMNGKSLTPRPLNLMNALTIDKVYLETTGAFYEGGPALTTRFGDLEVDYSPYIAHISETDGVIEGVQTSGLCLGPAELAGFYGWATRQVGEGEEATDVRFVDLGIYGQGEIEGIALQGAAVKTGDDMALAGTAQFAPAPGLDVIGSAAWDGANKATVAKVEAGIGEIPMLPEASAKVAFRSFDPLFNPVYRDDRKDKDTGEDINVVDINAGKRGVGGEIYTEIMGIGLTGKADWHEQRDINRDVVGARTTVGADAAMMYEGFDITAGISNVWSTVNAPYAILDRDEDADPATKTTLTLGVSRDFMVGPALVDASYDLELATTGSGVDSTHKVAASTSMDFPMFSDVEMSGNLKYAEGEATYMGKVGYTAPCGIEFIASYNRGYTAKRAEGLSLTAGMSVEF